MSGYFTDTVNLVFSEDQAITASADATNVIDTQATPTLKDLGLRKMAVEFIITEAFNTLTSLDFAVKSDSTTNLDTSETIHVARTVLLAGLTAGTRFTLDLPTGQTYERYLGVEYTVAGSNPSTGKIKAYLVPTGAPSMQYFPDGSSIVAG
jgi:hypothetical protein